MMKLLPLLAPLALAACATTSAGPDPAPALPEFSMATLTTVTQILSSDAYEGRAPTTRGEERTVE